MVYTWCTQCGRKCVSDSSHRAQGLIKYRADFMLGGRYGKRKRELFANKKDAVSFEQITQADYKRGTFLPDKGSLSFSALADKYYKEHCLQENRKPEASTFYRVEFAKDLFGKKVASSITREEIRKLRPELKDSQDWSNATINRFIGGVLKPIFNKGIEWELIDKNPCEHLSKLREEDPIPRFLTTDEIKTLFKSIKEPVLEDYANTILHSGARPSSIKECSFDSGDVDLTNRTIWFTTYKGNRKYRYAHPIDDVLYELILRRIAKTGGKGDVFDTSNIRHLAEEAIKESKINEGKTEAQHFTIYGLKHCYASHLLMSGASIFDVAKLLGHTDTKMVIKHYGHLTQEHLRMVQSKVNLTPKNQTPKTEISALIEKLEEI